MTVTTHTVTWKKKERKKRQVYHIIIALISLYMKSM